MKKQTNNRSQSKITVKKFDPFNDRLSRDIRNTLSEAFCRALVRMEQGCYQDAAEKWLATKPAARYCTYIQKRMQRYDRVFDIVASNGIGDALLQVLIIWNHELFFEVHEHLEPIWYQASGDQRQAIQGLIKAAGVYIHMEHQHQQAIRSLSAKSAHLIQEYSHCLTFISNLDLLIKKLKTVDPVSPKLENAALQQG